MADGSKLPCPTCGSPAVYRDGRTRAGKQRFICLMCGRQFVPGSERNFPDKRPLCPTCGAPMHLYQADHVQMLCLPALQTVHADLVADQLRQV